MTKALPKPVCFFFLFFAFILTKAVPKKGCFSFFCPNSNKKMDAFSNFALTLSKSLPQRVFFCIFAFCKVLLKKVVLLYLCPFSNQSLATKSFFLYFCPYSNHILIKRTCISIFASNRNQSPATKGVSLFLPLFLIKALPKRVFYSICALILAKAL